MNEKTVLVTNEMFVKIIKGRVRVMPDRDLEKRYRSISKFLSYVLRHHPEEVGIDLDDAGWVGIEELLAGCKRHGREITV